MTVAPEIIDGLPDGWEIKELGDIATLQRGKDLPKQHQVLGEYPIVGSSGIIGYHNQHTCEGPGVVTGRSGSIGKIAYVSGNYWAHNTGLYVKDFHGNNERFVYYLMHTLDFKKYATGVSVPTLNRNFIHLAKLKLPELTEQKKIASVLLALQDAKEKTGNVLSALKELRKSMMKHLFTFGLVPIEEIGRAVLKETEIGLMPEHWEVKSFGDIATLQRGKDLPKLQQIEGEYPVVGAGGVIGYHNEFTCEGPGIVTGRSGSIGNIAFVNKRFWAHNTGLYVKDYHGNEVKFVYYLMHIVNFKKYATGVSVPTLNRNFVHMAILPLPPRAEQEQIATILSSIDSKIEAEENKKNSLDALFKTLLSLLMTGKMRVNNLEI